MSDQQERNKALVMELTEQVWHQADAAAVPRYFAPGYRHSDPGLPAVSDRDGLAAYVAALPSMLSDLRITVHDLVAEGDKVVKRYTISATHTGELLGIPATGRSFAIEGSETFTIRDGQVVEATNVCDVLSMLQQLGLMPAPEAAAAT